MQTISNYTVHFFTGKTIPANIALQYSQERYKCFAKNDPHVSLNHDNETERDQFDGLDDTVYVTVVQGDVMKDSAKLISAMRLRSTDTAYELEQESYKYLTHSTDLPKTKEIVEGSRWVGKSSNTDAGKLSSALLILNVSRYAQQMGYKKLIGTASTKSFKWWNKRGSDVKNESDYYAPPHDELSIAISLFDLDETFLGAGITLLNSALHKISINTVGIIEEQNIAA